MKTNKVYLVGAGPGSPDLITVRGREILRQADVIIYDYLVDKRILEEAKEDTELICCDKLGKKRYSDGFLVHQEKINNLMVKRARQGKKVLRLKNGDPSIFSRLSQELEALVKHKIEFEIVPGVSAASGASGFSGIPLTDRRFSSSCVFVTGHEDPKKEKSALAWDILSKVDTLVLYMAVENLAKIVERLIKAGKSQNTPCVIIQNATLLTQKILSGTLKDIVAKAKKHKIRPPAIIIIGEVAKLEKRFNWFRQNRRILFTGLSKERFFIKGTYSHLPLIKIGPLKDYKRFDNYLKNIRKFGWIIFSSRYGVKYFFKRLKTIGYDSRVFKGIKFAAIGNSTKSHLLDFGINANLVPKEESSKGLLKEFKELNLKDKRIFLPHSDLSDKGLTNGLKAQGAKVVSCIGYKNVMPDYLPDLDLNSFVEIKFSSPSSVRNFVKRYGFIPKKVKVSCIGEVTRKEAKQCRLLD